MADLANVLRDLVLPMVEHPEKMSIIEKSGDTEKDVILDVTADSSDIARLIGRKGSMAVALRQVMSVASHVDHKRVHVQFNEIPADEAELVDSDKTVAILEDAE